MTACLLYAKIHKNKAENLLHLMLYFSKSRTGLLLDCTRFLSVVYCFCYGKVPVRCAGHSKEEKETNDENWI